MESKIEKLIREWNLMAGILCVYRNPNEHHRQDPVLLASKERNRFRSVTWDEYDSVHQKYLEIGKAKS